MEAAQLDKKLKFIGRERQPTALVAGGAGFLGSHLCEALVAQKFNVICVDNLLNDEGKQNIAGLLSLPNFSLWEEDINKSGFTISPTIPLTHIFHLASVEEYLAASETSLQTLLVNSFGTKNLLDLARERGAKFILVSSTEVFHGALSQTSLATYFNKEADPTSLSFSEAKRFAESLTAEYFKEYSLHTLIARIKDPYGPRMSLAAGALAGLIGQALRGDKIEIFGDGLRTLNPTYVTDVIFGLIKTALQGDKGEIFNLINPEKYTERAVAEHLKRIVGGLEIVYKKGEELELPSYPLIIGTAEEKIGWSPKAPLDQGLSSTIEFFRGEGGKKESEDKVVEKVMEKVAAPLVKERGNRKRWIRPLVFFACLALIFWTSVLPVGELAADIYFANRNLTAGLNNLLADKASLAGSQSSTALGEYQRGEQASGRLWFASLLRLKEPLKQTQNYLLYAENLATATKFSADALQLTATAAEATVADETVVKNVEYAKTNLELAKRSLELAASSKVVAEKLPGPLKSKYQALSVQEKDLEKLIDTMEEAWQTPP